MRDTTLITTTEAGQIIKRTAQTVRRMCETGAFTTAVRAGHYWLVQKWEAEQIAQDERQRRRT